jgi:hypothetical protein
MRADDDGFVNSPQRIMRMVSCSKNDMDMLVFKQFVIPFESGICVIKHWRIHNYLRNDRYRPTIYTAEKNSLSLDDSKAYVVGVPHGIPSGIPNDIPMGDAGKDRLGKDSIGKESIDNNQPSVPDGTTHKRFTPPTIDEVIDYCNERMNNIDPQRWYDFYTSKAWMIGKNKMKDWKAAIRTWETNQSSNGSSKIGKMGQAAYRQESSHEKLKRMLREAEERESIGDNQANNNMFG